MNAPLKTRLPALTRDLEQGKRDLSEWGYCLLADVISEDQRQRTLDRLQEQAELECETGVAYLANRHSPLAKPGESAQPALTSARWIGRPPEGEHAAWQGVTALLNKGREFVDLALNPKVHELAAHAFAGAHFDLSTMRGLIQRQGCPAGALHVDQPHVPFRTPVPVQNNSMITLSEFTEANGATRVVPGSHRLNPPHLGGDPEAGESVPMEAPPGSAIVWESRAWHHAGASTAEAVRYSIAMVFGQSFLRQQDVYAASLHDAVYDSLTEDERNLLGFGSPVGLNRIYPRFAGDRSNALAKGGNPYVPELRRGRL